MRVVEYDHTESAVANHGHGSSHLPRHSAARRVLLRGMLLGRIDHEHSVFEFEGVVGTTCYRDCPREPSLETLVSLDVSHSDITSARLLDKNTWRSDLLTSSRVFEHHELVETEMIREYAAWWCRPRPRQVRLQQRRR